MLQREMDSTVDYGIPSVEQKKGFLDKLFKKNVESKLDIESKLLDKVPVIKRKPSSNINIDDESLGESISKTPKWRGLKPLSRLGIPLQIMSVIAIGTLLGAAYAVTMKSGDQLQPKKELALIVDIQPVIEEQNFSKEAILPVFLQSDDPKIVAEVALQKLQKEVAEVVRLAVAEGQYFPEDATLPVLDQPEAPKIVATEGLQQEAGSQNAIFDETSLLQDLNGVVPSAEPVVIVAPKEPEIKNSPELDVLLSLNISIDQLSSDLEPEETSVEQTTAEGLDSSVNVTYEQKKIEGLQQQILSVKQKLKKYDQDNLSLKAKLALFTTKNKLLSEQFRDLEKLSDSLIKQLNFTN
jgi:hypothetical protein